MKEWIWRTKIVQWPMEKQKLDKSNCIKKKKPIQKYKRHTLKNTNACYPGQTDQKQLEKEAKAKRKSKVKITYCQDK